MCVDVHIKSCKHIYFFQHKIDKYQEQLTKQAVIQSVLLCDGIEQHSYSLITGTYSIPNTYSAFNYLYSKWRKLAI